ncbi:IPT/TIG domain-containing protein [Agromyces atrinae]|uniref:IPT/TIG domain-containing protein n=1 Tax=Agromyces atrinae TaxID=592376 RepID=A0A4Q2M3E7_9MICO|nr:IPT/TIG domain-containing protein [Agromyces atrinae]NYD65986.1 hypothetical protein [Agromyces atrinae]RXZ86318.1 hypothetical protein ESP50_11210 [Agromyces atrinae]
MAIVPVNPLILKDVILSFGADEYQASVSSVVFTPNSSLQTWQGLTATSTHTASTSATWSADITHIQDWDTPNSLSRLLYENEGAEIPVVLKPRSGSGPSFSVTIIVTPGAIGGAVNSWGESTVSLGAKGRPVLLAGAATIPVITGADKSTGPIAGGTLVEVSGSKFTGATAVHFGTLAATQFTVESDGTIFAVAPAQAAGSKPIKVTNAVGQSTTTAPYSYA